MDLTFRPLSPDTFDDYAAMQSRPECQGCFCMYWQFAGDNRDWQMSDAATNRDAKRALVDAGQTHGLLAYAGDHGVVGSVQFEPRGALPKLTRRGPYQQLGPDAGVWSLVCFRVLEAHRRRGVARALLAASVAHLREVHAATAVEAYPRRGEDLRDDEVWTGPESLFASAGFVEVRGYGQYPVFRRSWP